MVGIFLNPMDCWLRVSLQSHACRRYCDHHLMNLSNIIVYVPVHSSSASSILLCVVLLFFFVTRSHSHIHKSFTFVYTLSQGIHNQRLGFAIDVLPVGIFWDWIVQIKRWTMGHHRLARCVARTCAIESCRIISRFFVERLCTDVCVIVRCFCFFTTLSIDWDSQPSVITLLGVQHKQQKRQQIDLLGKYSS